MTSKTITLTGTATVRFKKTISGMDQDEIDELSESFTSMACNIDFDDLTEIIEIDDVELRVPHDE
ncbi:hypothetical protein D3C85_1094940 [compost metagenome]